ncbi:MAG TPA: VOC family protein [Dehalococcoidia bacterium]|nr:VOC family protein [Dehalococcoidia bacterium]
MITKMESTHYHVQDMDRAVRYYEGTLGLPLKFRDGDEWAEFKLEGGKFALERNHHDTAPAPGPTVTFRTDDLDALLNALTKAGHSVGEPEQRPYGRLVETYDTEGNVLMLLGD